MSTQPENLLGYEEAKALGEGKCDLCRQTRPLFLHKQKVTGEEFHDECEHCDGHEVDEIRMSNLCPRCWSDTPMEAVE